MSTTTTTFVDTDSDVFGNQDIGYDGDPAWILGIAPFRSVATATEVLSTVHIWDCVNSHGQHRIQALEFDYQDVKTGTVRNSGKFGAHCQGINVFHVSETDPLVEIRLWFGHLRYIETMQLVTRSGITSPQYGVQNQALNKCLPCRVADDNAECHIVGFFGSLLHWNTIQGIIPYPDHIVKSLGFVVRYFE